MRKLSIYLLALLFAAMMLVACDDDGNSNTTDKDPVTDTDTVNPDDDTATDPDTDAVDPDDDTATPDNDVVTDGTIEKIQSGEIAADTAVEFSGVVSALAFYEDNSHVKTMIKGFYVCNEASACVYVFIQAGVALESYKVGDAVEIAGKTTDFNGQKEIIEAEITITGDGEVPAPLVVNPAEVSTKFEDQGATDTNGKPVWTPTTHGAKSENYRGRLLKVENVTITSANMGHGLFEVTGNLGIAKNLYYYEGSRTEGTQFTSIVGVLDYTYEAFTLQPRSADDFVTGSTSDNCGNGTVDSGEECDGTELNGKACTDFSFTGGTLSCKSDCTFDKSACTGAPTYTISDVQKGDVAVGTEVSLSGLVVISPVYEGAYQGTANYSFYAADPAGGDYSGLYIYNIVLATGSAAPKYGDKIDVVGAVGEKDGLNELMFGDNDAITVTGTATPPEAVAVAVTATASVDAKYKGSLVTVTGEGLTVTAVPSSANYYVYELSNGLVIYGKFIDNDTFNNFATVGTTFSSITAIYDYQFNLMRLLPLSTDGMVKAQ